MYMSTTTTTPTYCDCLVNCASPLPEQELLLRVCEISTRTITCISSTVRFNITLLFDRIPTTDERKEGCVVFTKYERATKGTHPSPTYRPRKSVFRNSLTVIMYVFDSRGRGKYVNMKIPPSGLIQFTGCLEYLQALRAIYHVFKYIRVACPEGITCTGQDIRFTCKIHMTNIKLHLNDCHVNRTVLQQMTTHKAPKDWRAMFDPTGYSGVNIKCKYDIELEEIPMHIPTIVIPDGCERFEDAVVSCVPYHVFLKDNTTSYERERTWFDTKRLSILMFQTGTITLSGIHETVIAPVWKEFDAFINEHRESIFFSKETKIVNY